MTRCRTSRLSASYVCGGRAVDAVVYPDASPRPRIARAEALLISALAAGRRVSGVQTDTRHDRVALILLSSIAADAWRREQEPMRILVVEDQVKMAGLLRRGLIEEGYAVDIAGSGTDALWAATEQPFDVVVLDLMLPDMSGLDVCRELRGRGRWVPVLILTARDGVPDRVAGLDAGADDYLTKPFAFTELFARIRALVRRGPSERPSALRVGGLVLEPSTRIVSRDGARIDLTAKEFALLDFLMRHPGEVLSRTRIVEHVWDYAYDGDSNVVDVYIRYLREKVDRPFGQRSIETVRGSGYRLRAEPNDGPADPA
jgi:two-component system, OmpR family, response regulator